MVNVAAVAWLLLEAINIAWPRESPRRTRRTYQVWAAPILLATIALVGLAYLVVTRTHRRP
ncbi:MAG: hypothetical protein M3401_13885 [Actinomycetota bacterium]|nr:hypothetical protein [Actinomycetota bacterium]